MISLRGACTRVGKEFECIDRGSVIRGYGTQNMDLIVKMMIVMTRYLLCIMYK